MFLYFLKITESETWEKLKVCKRVHFYTATEDNENVE